jgi:signal recognition particle subunit SRP54
MGTGEKMEALELFQAERIAGSILGMGDIVGLVEKASEVVGQEEAEKMAKKMLKGQFTLDDMAQQLSQVKKMGNLEGLLGMMPGAQNIKKQMAGANIDDKLISRQEAIIRSMTKKERFNPKVLNGSRRRRIAEGSGTTVPDVNRVLKQFKQMSQMMKKVGKMGKNGMMRGGGMSSGMMPQMPPGGFR